MHTTIIATSLNEESKSQLLARRFRDLLIEKGNEDTTFLDLRDLPLPLSGASNSWEDPNVSIVSKSVQASSHIVFSVPVYCYDVNAVVKNVIELAGRSFASKVVGFICSAGWGEPLHVCHVLCQSPHAGF